MNGVPRGRSFDHHRFIVDTQIMTHGGRFVRLAQTPKFMI